MASNYYGLNKGQHQQDVATGTSTQSTDVELRVDTSKITSKEDAILAVTQILNAFVQSNF